MKKALPFITLLFFGCTPQSQPNGLHFETIDYTYDAGLGPAYSMRIHQSGLVILGRGRRNLKYHEARLSPIELKSIDSLLHTIPFNQYDSSYQTDIVDQSSYKLVIPGFNESDTVSILVYGDMAPPKLDTLSTDLNELKEKLHFQARDTSIDFLSLHNFYIPAPPPPIKGVR